MHLQHLEIRFTLSFPGFGPRTLNRCGKGMKIRQTHRQRKGWYWVDWVIRERKLSVPEVQHAHYISLSKEVSLLNTAEGGRFNSSQKHVI